MPRILIVEDNAELAEGIRFNLQLEGWEVDVAEDGVEGLRRIRAREPDLLILDLMLPGLDGFRLLEAIRNEGRRLPVMILTARGTEADKVRGFRLDADQYVTKPFGVLELIERCRSLLRREAARSGAAVAADAPIRFGDVVIDPSARTVSVRGELQELTPKAYELMMALIRRRGAVATRLELQREVWGHRGIVLSRTVDSRMAELRRKLERDPAEPRHFVTVWKVGYRFQP